MLKNLADEWNSNIISVCSFTWEPRNGHGRESYVLYIIEHNTFQKKWQNSLPVMIKSVFLVLALDTFCPLDMHKNSETFNFWPHLKNCNED